MTLDSLLTQASIDLDDINPPYRWADSTLVNYFNQAEREACRRANLIIDKTTDAYCRIPLVAGHGRYTTDVKVLRVLGAYYGARKRGTLTWTAATKTLSDAGSGFITAGFEEEDRVAISGFTNGANNGLFSISTIAAGSIVVEEETDSDGDVVVLVNETATDAVIEVQKKELSKKTAFALDELYPGWNTEIGEPEVYIEEENNELVVVPAPEYANTLFLTVVRLPASDMTLALKDTVSPEIPAHYHYDLLDWVYHLAYLKDDADSQDLKKARMYEDSFTAKFGPRPSARAEIMRKRYPRSLSARPQSFG